MSEMKAAGRLEAEAMQAYERGDLSAAESAFHAAEKAYDELGEVAKSAEMANNRSVVLLATDPGEALKAVMGTPEVFERNGKKNEAAQALGNIAAALEGLNDLEKACEYYRLCANRLGELGAADAQSAALQSLSKLQLKMGQPIPALAAMEAGLDAQPRKGIRNRLLRKLLSLPERLLKR